MWARSYLWASTCHETHTAIDTVMCEFIIADTNAVPQLSLTIVVLHRIHGLMMVSNVWVEWSATGARQVSPIPAWPEKNATLSHATGQNYTFACWSIYQLFPQHCHPHQSPLKKSCKEQIKIKFDIALQQNCNQWATVWWSKRSSALNGGSQNGALLGMRVQTVTEGQPKW